MRTEISRFSFNAAANGATIAEIDLQGVERTAISLIVTAIGGTFGTAAVYGVPLAADGTTELADANSPAIGALTVTALSTPNYSGTQDAVFGKVRLKLDLQGGVTTATGIFTILTRRW